MSLFFLSTAKIQIIGKKSKRNRIFLFFGYAPGCMMQEEDGAIWGNDLLLHPCCGVIQKLGFWDNGKFGFHLFLCRNGTFKRCGLKNSQNPKIPFLYFEEEENSHEEEFISN